MWKKPWGIREGVAVCIGLVIIGQILQYSIGPVNWQNFAMPVNIVVIIAYLLVISFLYLLKNRIYFVQWAMSYASAIPSLCSIVCITVIMGLTRQTQSDELSHKLFAFNNMLSYWPFVLLYVWMTTIVGLASLKHIHHFRLGKIPFLLNHLGLFLALVTATLGSADMIRLTMNTKIGEVEWRGMDKSSNIHELPLAIELNSFTIEEYPAKLMMIDNATGKAIPEDNPEHLYLDSNVTSGNLNGWNVKIIKSIELAAPVASADSIKYVEWPNIGATYATLIEVSSPDNSVKKEGWVSCGSFAFPYQALRLNEKYSIVTPDREPKRFISNVEIYTKSGIKRNFDIEVNKPVKVEGWKIYQLSYDETKGKWSDTSVFELVYDPWLPFVYVGIIMMILGSVCMFTISQRVREDRV